MSRTRKMLVAGAVVVAATGAVGVTVASAAAPGGSVGVHQHYAVTSDGSLVRVGPNACKDGQSLQFDNFHNNGHKGVPGDLGVITGKPCSFVP